MILADKIIEERKKNGWSQEELAEKLDVSRQSVSKWEGAQSTPDLQKILKMSQLFGVSTDYLLKDELEKAEYVESQEENAAHKVSMEEANEFLALNERSSFRCALAAVLAIISPVFLLFMGGMVSADPYMEAAAVGLGVPTLFILFAAAVLILITNGMKLSRYRYLDKEDIETAYGVSGMVRDRKEKYADKYRRSIIAGVVLCALGVISVSFIPMLGGTDMIGAVMVCVLLLFEAAGVFLIVRASCIRSGFNKLLR